MIERRLLEADQRGDAFLRRRDEAWDFRGTPAARGAYGIHPYPAMFHSGVVRGLLERFSQPGDFVLDPFVGSGVAAVEAAVAGRRFYGCDINQLAILVAQGSPSGMAY